MPAKASWKLLSAPVLAWITYDLANTLFSYALITRYFNDYVINQKGAPDIAVGVMGFCVSMVLVFTLPLFGAMADRSGRRVSWLRTMTLISVCATAALGLGLPLTLILGFGAVAIWAYQSAIAHYDPLLGQIAPDEQRSRVSGIGTAAGYLGVVVAVLVLGALVGADKREAFLPTAALWGILALPALLLIRQPPRSQATRARLREAVQEARRGVMTSLRQARRRPHGRFLLARFFYVDAVATVIAFMAVFAKRVGELTDGQVDKLLLFSIIASMAGALSCATAAGRVGPRRALLGVVGFAVVTLLATALVGKQAVIFAGPAVGFILGGLGAVDRLMLMRLVPDKSQHGSAFGLYALVGKLSSGLGPLVLWGGTIYLLHNQLSLLSLQSATRIAVGVLAAAALLGWLLLRGVPEPEPNNSQLG